MSNNVSEMARKMGDNSKNMTEEDMEQQFENNMIVVYKKQITDMNRKLVGQKKMLKKLRHENRMFRVELSVVSFFKTLGKGLKRKFRK